MKDKMMRMVNLCPNKKVFVESIVRTSQTAWDYTAGDMYESWLIEAEMKLSNGEIYECYAREYHDKRNGEVSYCIPIRDYKDYQSSYLEEGSIYRNEKLELI